jgi:hypothetical protein
MVLGRGYRSQPALALLSELRHMLRTHLATSRVREPGLPFRSIQL